MVVEFTSDHAAHQQKLLEMLRSGADSDIIVYKTREIISFGDPSHTLKLWRSSTGGIFMLLTGAAVHGLLLYLCFTYF